MILKTAVISPCGLYRYSLGREDDMPRPDTKGTVVFGLANPSTADAEFDDATVKKGWKYAVSWNYHRMIYVNLNPFRATDPKKALIPPPAVMAENDTHLRFAISQADLFVCAWGRLAPADLVERAMGVIQFQKPLYYLELSKDGKRPKHPLYLRDDLQPTRWRLNDLSQS